MLNIVVALSIEAKPIISKFNLKSNGLFYENENIKLIVSGQGKIKSAIATTLILSKNKAMTLNFGIVGSNKFNIGDGFFINKIVDTDTNFNYYPDRFYEPYEELFCVSKIGEYYSLVDMESSGFFEAAYKFLNVDDILLYKIVSDTPYKNSDNIEDLINSHLEIIEFLINSKKKDNFFDEIDNFIAYSENFFHLTSTQKTLFKDILVMYKLKNISFPKLYNLTTKKEVKEFLNELSKKVK